MSYGGHKVAPVLLFSDTRMDDHWVGITKSLPFTLGDKNKRDENKMTRNMQF